MKMFCRQCEQTTGSNACTIMGTCGKDSQVAILQDLLIYSLKGIAIYAKMAQELGVENSQVDLFMMEGLFSTVTNVNFNPEQLQSIILDSYRVKEKVKLEFLQTYKHRANKDFSASLPSVVDWIPADNLEGLIEQGGKVGIMADTTIGEDVRSLQELILYGLKGMAAYADHAFILGKQDKEVSFFFYKALAALSEKNISVADLTNLTIELGRVNLKCLEMLDKAHSERFGSQLPTKVRIGVEKGPAIIVSGHDLCDLEQLLQQSEGKNIKIYTHGEMLTAHAYPKLKKYKHLAGHFGGGWQDQRKEFDNIPAAILMTTNCIQKPKDSYKDRIFTTGLVSWPGVEHIDKADKQKDFSRVINKARELGGFSEEAIEKEITVGFAHQVVLGIAGKIVQAVNSGAIRHFFLIGGCDGAKPGRNYYTEFAQKVPADCIILTLACGKFRFNKLEFGAIDGIPRLLDCGQCNDAYSAIKIVSALAESFNCSVNELPLSIILSWYEQKAVCILLTLLSLGIKNIRIGPSLPTFISPNILKMLVEQFNIQPITNADDDLKAILTDKQFAEENLA